MTERHDEKKAGHEQKHAEKQAEHQTKHAEKKEAKQTPGELKPTESPGASQKEKDDLGQGGH
jgi:hypothetical protein